MAADLPSDRRVGANAAAEPHRHSAARAELSLRRTSGRSGTGRGALGSGHHGPVNRLEVVHGRCRCLQNQVELLLSCSEICLLGLEQNRQNLRPRSTEHDVPRHGFHITEIGHDEVEAPVPQGFTQFVWILGHLHGWRNLAKIAATIPIRREHHDEVVQDLPDCAGLGDERNDARRIKLPHECADRLKHVPPKVLTSIAIRPVTRHERHLWPLQDLEKARLRWNWKRFELNPISTLFSSLQSTSVSDRWIAPSNSWRQPIKIENPFSPMWARNPLSASFARTRALPISIEGDFNLDHANDYANYDVSADDQQFLMVEAGDQPREITVVLGLADQLERLAPHP